MQTKKDFKNIGTILKDTRANEDIIKAFISYFKRENGNFNGKRFLKLVGREDLISSSEKVNEEYL